MKQVKKLKDLTWQEINKIAKQGKAAEVFKIGDKKRVKLYTGETVNATIIGFNHDDLVRGGKAKISFALDLLDGEFEMNKSWSNAGGWDASVFKNVYTKRFFKLLPQDLQKQIKNVVKITSIGNASDELIKSIDKLFLFSEVEVRGRNSYSASGEGSQYEHFKKDKNIALGRWYWLRSPYSGDSNNFCGIDDSGYITNINASSTYPTRLGFCL